MNTPTTQATRIETHMRALATRQPSWMMRVWVDSTLAELGLTYDSAAQTVAWRVANALDTRRMLARA